MATSFDINTLSRDEMDQILHRVNLKTEMLQKDFVANNEVVMKFIQKIAMKSDSKQTFFKMLSEKLQLNRSPQTIPTSSPNMDNDANIFNWFQSNQGKLQALLIKLANRSSQQAFLPRLAEGLRIAKHFPRVSNLNEPQMQLLRELHDKFLKRNEAAQSMKPPPSGIAPSSSSIVHPSNNGLHISMSIPQPPTRNDQLVVENPEIKWVQELFTKIHHLVQLIPAVELCLISGADTIIILG
jgi:hypothetical protein